MSQDILLQNLTPALIALEGIDATGKSTIAPLLSNLLKQHNINNITTYEPTRGNFGLKIRSSEIRLPPDLEIELLLKDRQEHLKNVILPALKKGITVITDRYYYSSIAYQGTRLEWANPQEKQREIQQLNEKFAPPADILIYFDLKPEQAFERISRDREKADYFENLENLRRVYTAYLTIIQEHPRMISIDASLPPQQILKQLKNELLHLI